ncbi:MAG: DUF4430 domain-containing protein [Clostridia bacterium]|nr:DUF4430 domain-containing protein [Clostridia bacterium]
MKKTLRILALLLALILTTFAFAACGTGETEAPQTNTDNSSVATKITITVEVVDDKGESTKFTIETAEEFLRGALEQEKLVEGEDGPYGLYIKKVNGISADYNTDGAYWQVFEGETAAMTGVEKIKLKDGGLYKLVYTKG